jgi:hypothetical protein
MDNPLKVPAPFDTLGDNPRNMELLIEQLRTGGVIPFVGAGMSAPFNFPDWKAFLLKQAPNAQIRKKVNLRLAKGQYEEAAEDLLRIAGTNSFQDAIDATFGPSRLGTLPEDAAVCLLPALCPGPVLTTNFDSVLEKVYEVAVENSITS